MSDDPTLLRHRAGQLQELARRIDALGLDTLLDALGETTWLGPTPERCRDTLRAHRRQLRDAADTLRAHARRLIARADATAGR